MLVPVRTMKKGKLRYKNSMSIEDMRVRASNDGLFVIQISMRDGKDYLFDHFYNEDEEAEDAMTELAEKINRMEEEQTDW